MLNTGRSLQLIVNREARAKKSSLKMVKLLDSNQRRATGANSVTKEIHLRGTEMDPSHSSQLLFIAMHKHYGGSGGRGCSRRMAGGYRDGGVASSSRIEARAPLQQLHTRFQDK